VARRLMVVFGRTSLTAAIALAVGCHGRNDSPTAASATGAQGKLSVESLRTSGPIVGATVKTTLGASFTTDGEGSVVLPDTSVGRVVTIEAPLHYGPYRFTYAPDTKVRMLPADTGMPASWIKEALFASNDFQWMWRPEPGVMVVVPSAQLLNDEFSYEGLVEGIDILNRSHRHVRMVMKTEPAATDRVITIRVNEAARGFASTLISVTPGTATTIGATIEFSVVRLPNMHRALQRLHFIRAVAHELAHVAGINGHPPAIAGVSNGGIMWGAEPVQDFSQPEKDIMDWEFTLPPGTRPPADTTQLPVAAKSIGAPAWHAVCSLGYDGTPIP